ncbi:MAG: HD-GYP domain-containing protein [Deltaproteobacteria bacterium]|nr:HD-GYP domain-containing protein [Deltaproteobacteria bacterium]
MDISVIPPEIGLFEAKPPPPAGGREIFKLRALRDFTLCFARGRDFDESLRLALMVVLGTCSIAKGALFLEEDGEFRVQVSRGLPPGIPPLEESRNLLMSLRRAVRPVCVNRRATAAAIRKAVAEVERAVPAFPVEYLCPLGTKNGPLGFLLLGCPITGEGLTVRQRETLSVMASILSSYITNQRVVRDMSRLNDVLRFQVQENERLLEGMQEIYLDTIRALATAVEAKDPYTRGHSERVAKISVSIAKGLMLPEKDIQAVRIASILHDVGKIGTSRSILTKPSSLTAEEREEIRKHPRVSFDILSEIRFPYPNVALLARGHHEWLDGSGYPDGKREPQIPVGARIIALADAFDAMVSDRPYRSSLTLLHALGEIRACLHSHYDAGVARMFFRHVRREVTGELPDGPVLTGLVKGYSRTDAVEFIDRALRELGPN